MNIAYVLVGVCIGLVFYISFAALIRKFWVAPPEEPDPENIEPVDMNYRCGVCGAEVTMTMTPSGEEPTAPRHCREDMILTTSN